MRPFELARKHYYESLLRQVNRLEAKIRPLSDEELKRAAMDLRERRYQGAKLDALLPELYAMVREASRRTLNMRHYDVQIVGGIGLHHKNVIEMETGEGKTLVATLAACLHSLGHKPVHIITVNDYLAERDAKWMEPIYRMLGFTVGCVLCDAGIEVRKKAYACDITYSTVRTLGFDFLREWFEKDPTSLDTRGDFVGLYSVLTEGREESCLRGRHFAILDEADSVLIDFARAPVAITEKDPMQAPPDVYMLASKFALELKEDGDYTIEQVRKKVELKDSGKQKADWISKEYAYLRLSPETWEDRLIDAITAEKIYVNGRDYVIQGENVILIDDITGRLLLGQRLGQQMHQAMEAKEKLPIQPQTRVARKITVQALFRAYKQLGGMTGTAWGARKEFKEIYRMRVLRLPTNRPIKRNRAPDKIFHTADERWDVVANDIARAHSRGQPVLVGTRSVRASEQLSEMLKARGIDHHLLNATNHAAEAEIIKGAGQMGTVTVSANMAGRGVDILLGHGVAEIGGLRVIGTERHEVARFDHQLGGRCGRQGDPGEVQYYFSVQDDILKALPKKKYEAIQKRYSKGKGEIEDRGLRKAYDKAQDIIERYFAEVRRNLMVRDEFYEYLERTPV
ncbi:MAG TPA: preprotein translocase subunit SecA [Candidatus Brocadiia bacterium]|nr:preprotein translocase subunit SecA [Candidatus Brocadiia bacterium]